MEDQPELAVDDENKATREPDAPNEPLPDADTTKPGSIVNRTRYPPDREENREAPNLCWRDRRESALKWCQWAYQHTSDALHRCPTSDLRVKILVAVMVCPRARVRSG